jgi:UDPglucose--hexose-1-phosphate uridylyltransferase
MLYREWVIITTDERAKGPCEFIAQKNNRKNRPEFLSTCPFCPGNEHRTPEEIISIRGRNSWELRVIPNKFPTLSPDGKRERVNKGIRHIISGVGINEIVIESPIHNIDLSQISYAHLNKIIKTYRDRYTEIYKDPRIDHVIVFKNHGEDAGSCISHPHSQIIGSPVTPVIVRNRMDEAMRYFDSTGQCLVCSILQDEISDERRIILNTEHFITFIPYAALSPFHTWIFPKRHSATFCSISDEEIADLSGNIKTILSKFRAGLDDPDFNLMIRSYGPKEIDSEYLHWYVSIIPRILSATGFELGSGIYVNTTIPEKSAGFLRNVIV